jgi:hypothetical protein
VEGAVLDVWKFDKSRKPSISACGSIPRKYRDNDVTAVEAFGSSPLFWSLSKRGEATDILNVRVADMAEMEFIRRRNARSRPKKHYMDRALSQDARQTLRGRLGAVSHPVTSVEVVRHADN